MRISQSSKPSSFSLCQAIIRLGMAPGCPNIYLSVLKITFQPQCAGSRSAANGTARSARPSPLRVSHARVPSSRENSVPNTPSTDGPCLCFSSKKEERIQKVPPPPHPLPLSTVRPCYSNETMRLSEGDRIALFKTGIPVKMFLKITEYVGK